MKSHPVLVLVFGILLSIGLIGCGGGGGGSGVSATAPDAGVITQRLSSFVKAMANGKVSEAVSYMSPRMAAVSGGSGSLLVKDFGSDITDSSDDRAFTFFIPSDGIIQHSADLASVRAEYNSPAGTLIVINFSLLRVEGTWYIDDIKVTSSTTQTYALAPWFHFKPANAGTYKIKYGNGLDSTYSVRYSIAPGTKQISYVVPATPTSPSTTQTVTVYSSVPEALDQNGAVVSMSSVAGSAREDDPDYRLPWNTGFAAEGFAVSSGLQYFGITDSESSFNGGKPWQIIPPLVRIGDVATQTLTYGANTYDAETVIGNWTKVGDLDAIPVTIKVRRVGGPVDPGATLYLNQNYGLVRFSKPTTSASYTELLSQVTIDGQTTKTPTTVAPIGPVAPTATPTMSVLVYQKSSSQIEVRFADLNNSNTRFNPDQNTALNTANYLIFKQEEPKDQSTPLASQSLAVSSVALGPVNPATGKVDSILVNAPGGLSFSHPRLQVKVSNVYSDDRTKIAASAPVDLASHSRFIDYRAWSVLGAAAGVNPLRIVLPNAADGKLFMMFSSLIKHVTVSETTNAANQKVLAFNSPTDWSTGFFTSGETFFDFSQAQAASNYWVAGTDVGAGPFVGLVNQSGILVKHSLAAWPSGLMNPFFGRGFSYNNGRTFIVVANRAGNLQSYEWNGPTAPTLRDSRTFTPGFFDIRAFHDPANNRTEFALWRRPVSTNDSFEFLQLNDTGLFVTPAPATVYTPFSFSTSPVLTWSEGGMYWFKGIEATGLPDSFLFAAGNAGTNSVLGHRRLNQNPPSSLFQTPSGEPADTLQGGLKTRDLSSNPTAMIEVFRDSAAPSSGAGLSDFWLLVGDHNGLATFKYKN